MGNQQVTHNWLSNFQRVETQKQVFAQRCGIQADSSLIHEGSWGLPAHKVIKLN